MRLTVRLFQNTVFLPSNPSFGFSAFNPLIIPHVSTGLREPSLRVSPKWPNISLWHMGLWIYLWRFSAKIKTKKFLFKILLQINSAHISPSTSTEGQGALHTVEQKCWGTKKATIQQKYCKNPKMLRRHVGKETGRKQGLPGMCVDTTQETGQRL